MSIIYSKATILSSIKAPESNKLNELILFFASVFYQLLVKIDFSIHGWHMNDFRIDFCWSSGVWLIKNPTLNWFDEKRQPAMREETKISEKSFSLAYRIESAMSQPSSHGKCLNCHLANQQNAVNAISGWQPTLATE